MNKQDPAFIRKTIAIARRSRERGNHPFGAILVGPDQQILLEAENTVVSDRDLTGHAETNLIRKATKTYPPEYLKGCTLYTSTEPCPMCAGAIFWSNIRRVVFGLSEDRFYSLIDENTTEEVLKIPCRKIFQQGQKVIKVAGPVLEDEAAEVHRGFWNRE